MELPSFLLHLDDPRVHVVLRHSCRVDSLLLIVEDLGRVVESRVPVLKQVIASPLVRRDCGAVLDFDGTVHSLVLGSDSHRPDVVSSSASMLKPMTPVWTYPGRKQDF